MEYYYGTALTIGGDIKIRVKPDNIQGGEILELEMLLSRVVGHKGRYNVGSPISETNWETRRSKTGGMPGIYGSRVTLDIDGEQREYRFINSEDDRSYSQTDS